jgi:hypothetical protein
MVLIGSMDMETLDAQRATKMMAYAYIAQEALSLTQSQRELLRMSFVMKAFTLGFPIYQKRQSIMQQTLLEKLSTNLKRTTHN